MSRIGKKIITLPAKTEIKVSEGIILVKGPLGEISRSFKPVVDINIEGNEVTVVPKNDDLETRALWGTYASHITNMIQGVNTLYEKKLEIEGVGYKAAINGDILVLTIGFSHTVPLTIPKGVNCVVEKNLITINGIDKEVIGEFAAVVRSKKKPEPYKGKGIHYVGEHIRRKEGKRAV